MCTLYRWMVRLAAGCWLLASGSAPTNIPRFMFSLLDANPGRKDEEGESGDGRRRTADEAEVKGGVCRFDLLKGRQGQVPDQTIPIVGLRSFPARFLNGHDFNPIALAIGN
ncbi:hypothetical protein B0T19DRAFT_403406 [Cercophora scortea]|uniref:Secreted protein n=1 Tax=Cercophora scortea TaxID=314031 RepID=A0AAE0I912_9PEZI|nr:hypothetical protein B0T19DRAFT_403406 [Cercophora scortea]